MSYTIRFTDAVKFDLEEIQMYYTHEVSSKFAGKLINELLDTIYSLTTIPERGHFPPELHDTNDQNIREIHCKPYRIFYEIFDTDIVILAVADGRRDIRELLQRRLFRS